MKYAEWLEQIRPHMTGKGARLDLRLYIYPDGHGNIIVRQDDEPGQPVNNFEEARRVLEDLWRKASTSRQPARSADADRKLAALLEQITPENLHEEVKLEGPVGNEVW